MRAARSATAMSAEGSQRREFIAGLAGAAAVGAALPANAIIDYAGLPGLGGSDKIDINNANVRVYVKIQGMYPGCAGKVR
jgi:photosystem II PsbU protein